MAVPSRCYYSQQLPGKPLLGWRIVVKDILDIEGSQTTLCNRAWGEFHGTKPTTASCIRRLQELGAYIIGKARLNAMLVREETIECVEFLAPFNPRGDEYQTSSGSSSGSCAALAAYSWVDFAIGSDSTSPFMFLSRHRRREFSVDLLISWPQRTVVAGSRPTGTVAMLSGLHMVFLTQMMWPRFARKSFDHR